MANYVQWSESKKLGRVVWLYGPEDTLKLEVADFVRSTRKSTDLDTYFFEAGSDSDDAIWETVYTRSLSDEALRLVEIRNAEKLRSLDRLEEWVKSYARYSAETTVLVMADEAPVSKVLKAPKVTVIRCALPKPEDRLKWTRSRGHLSETSAARLVEYKNGDLNGIANICDKLTSLLPEEAEIDITKEVLAAIDDETPYSLVEAILERDKPAALESASVIAPEAVWKTLVSLDYNLTLIERLRQVLQDLPRGQRMENIPGFPMARVSDLAPLARTYSAKDVVKCKQLIVLIESYVRRGISEGALEALVTLW